MEFDFIRCCNDDTEICAYDPKSEGNARCVRRRTRGIIPPKSGSTPFSDIKIVVK